jgi:hypothetical protein
MGTEELAGAGGRPWNDVAGLPEKAGETKERLSRLTRLALPRSCNILTYRDERRAPCPAALASRAGRPAHERPTHQLKNYSANHLPSNDGGHASRIHKWRCGLWLRNRRRPACPPVYTGGHGYQNASAGAPRTNDDHARKTAKTRRADTVVFRGRHPIPRPATTLRRYSRDSMCPECQKNRACRTPQVRERPSPIPSPVTSRIRRDAAARRP